MIDPTPAINRVFRLYFAYCQKWNQDTLFNLLEALHSLDDKLGRENKHPMLDIPEYVALKAVRNHFHHAEEVRSRMRIKSVQGLLPVDIAYACLIATKDCVAALAAVPKKYHENTRQAMASTFKFWGTVIDINPCVFNCMAKIYALLNDISLFGDGEDFEQFAKLHEFETERGHSHFVTGAIITHPADAGRVQTILENLYTS